MALSLSLFFCTRYYNSYHQCKYDFSEEEPQCAKLKQWATSMCPEAWVSQPCGPRACLETLRQCCPGGGSLYCRCFDLL
eukprot:scaffold11371_cov112-Isochrysis_galbana.AAC.2